MCNKGRKHIENSQKRPAGSSRYGSPNFYPTSSVGIRRPLFCAWRKERSDGISQACVRSDSPNNRPVKCKRSLRLRGARQRPLPRYRRLTASNGRVAGLGQNSRHSTCQSSIYTCAWPKQHGHRDPARRSRYSRFVHGQMIMHAFLLRDAPKATTQGMAGWLEVSAHIFSPAFRSVPARSCGAVPVPWSITPSGRMALCDLCCCLRPQVEQAPTGR